MPHPTHDENNSDTFSDDEQKWYLDNMGSGKFMMRNEEEDKHCVTVSHAAPGMLCCALRAALWVLSL